MFSVVALKLIHLPSFITDNLIFLDSSLDVAHDANGVSAWRNQGRGGSAYDATQGTDANKPSYVNHDRDFNGRPVLSFNGSTNYMAAATAALMWSSDCVPRAPADRSPRNRV